MTKNVNKKSSKTIDNELFQFYTRYQMCQIQKSTSFWSNSKEKEAMLAILTEFEHVDGNTLRLIVDQIFENSVQKFNTADKEPEEINSAMNVNHSTPIDDIGMTKMEAIECKHEYALEEASTSNTLAINMISAAPVVENESIIAPGDVKELLSIPSIEGVVRRHVQDNFKNKQTNNITV
ncbi:hypothetical protein [Parasitella parasitica]|uniref:Uncharacterized protein n=1 Tax=Parasitella parasitica TaxID=35722 RepID=A0A0B7NDQ9_9FUNG|nr:hypothetical protein [Parasitella parasitica]